MARTPIYTGINKKANNYIPISTDEVNKCKSFANLLVCEHTEPARKKKPPYMQNKIHNVRKPT